MGEVEHNYLGFYIGNKMVRQDPQIITGYNASLKGELDPICEEMLYKVFDYIRENNLKVLFFDSPQLRNEVDMGRANTVYSILEKEGFDYVHFYDENDPDGITIDFNFETDFYNPAHTNFYGAAKFTEAFSAYLNENYDLPDRSSDENVNVDWDGVHDALAIKIQEIEAEKGVLSPNSDTANQLDENVNNDINEQFDEPLADEEDDE